MRPFIFLYIFLSATICTGQPTGKLFVHTGYSTYGSLGYIQYPYEQYYFIDSAGITDMKIFSNKLFISGEKIYSYDLNTLQKTDSIDITSAAVIGNENHHLIVVRSLPPFFQVYDLLTKNLIFSLDTNKLNLQPVDMLVDAGKVFLLLDTSIIIVDIALQDTLATLTATYNSWFPCFNQYLINDSDKIYIHVGIATGAPRCAMLSMDKSSFQVQDVFFLEFVDAYYKPVLAGNKMYLSYFPSYYNIAADTFYFDQHHSNTFPLLFDKTSNTFFLYNSLNFNISFFYNNLYSSGEIIPDYLNKAAYYDETGVSIRNEEDANMVNIYPNPFTNKVCIDFGRALHIRSFRFFSLNCNSKTYLVNENLQSLIIDTGHLHPGVYLMELQFDNFTVKKKFVKIGEE